MTAGLGRDSSTAELIAEWHRLYAVAQRGGVWSERAVMIDHELVVRARTPNPDAEALAWLNSGDDE